MTDGVQANEVDAVAGIDDRAADDRPGALTDVVLPGSRRRHALGIALGLSAAAILGVVLSSFIRNGTVTTPTLVVCLVAAVAIWIVMPNIVMGRHQRLAERIVRETADADDGTLLARLIEKVTPITVTDTLVKHARWGMTGRLARERDFSPIEPITVPFEPQLLGEGDPPSDLAASGRDADDGAPWAADGSPTRTPRRGGRGGGWKKMWRPISTAVSITISILFLILAWRSGRALFVFVAMLCLGLELLKWVAPGTLWASRQCLAVPGGLVVRESGFLRQSWRLHVYGRRTSVLTAARKADEQWFLCVADATKKSIFMLKPADVEFLLRAWLSPLAPPAVEQLSDLQ